MYTMYINILTLAHILRYISSSFTEKALDCRKCKLMLSWSSQLLSSWAHLFMDRSVQRETYGYHGWPSDCTVTTLPASWKRSGSCIVWFLIHWRLWFASLKEDYNIFGIVLGLFGTSQTMNSLRWFGPKMLKFRTHWGPLDGETTAGLHEPPSGRQLLYYDYVGYVGERWHFLGIHKSIHQKSKKNTNMKPILNLKINKETSKWRLDTHSNCWFLETIWKKSDLKKRSIFHPPSTHFCESGHWTISRPKPPQVIDTQNRDLENSKEYLWILFGFTMVRWYLKKRFWWYWFL